MIIIGLILGLVTGWVVTNIAISRTRLEKIVNSKKKSSADSHYWLLEISQDEQYMFTDEQLKVAKERAEKNFDDID